MAAHPTGLLHAAALRWAVEAPDAPAVADESLSLSYGELERWSRAVAALLRRRGCPRGASVGVGIERSSAYVAAALGVLRAGCAMVPLDPALPLRRQAEMRTLAGVTVTLVRRPDADGAGEVALPDPHEAPRAREDAMVAAADAAYVLFTSGSTGAPRGVVVEHRNIAALLDGIDALAPLAEGGSGTAVCPIGFDVSMWEIFSVLRAGGRVLLPGPGAVVDGRSLARRVLDERVANVYVPPALLAGFTEAVEDGGGAPALGRVLVGVEPIPQGLLGRLQAAAPQSRLVNGYGPTETSVCATAHVFERVADPARRVPIGRALPGYRVHVVDDDLTPVPHGATGEVVVGGAGVARGYASDPGRTAAAFVPDPFSEDGGRLYRTGDHARVLDDGALEFAGRVDTQVKIRGFRVDLAEVEAALSSVAGVRRALARAVPAGQGCRLVGFVEAAGTTEEATRAHAAERLPAHAVPDRVVVVPAFPLTDNGKVDDRALQRFVRQRPARLPPPNRPETALESDLLRIWKDVLELDEAGIDDDFVSLGGTSLLALTIAARARAELSLDLGAGAVLEARTVRDLAGRAASAAHGAGEAPGVDGLATPSQEGLWLAQELDPGGNAFVEHVALTFAGASDGDAVAAAVRAVAARHEAFRTSFRRESGRLRRIVSPREDPGAGARIHRLETGAESFERVAARVVRETGALPLSAPPWSATVATGDAGVLLVLVAHHAVFDGWSARLFVNEVVASLEGRAGTGPGIPAVPPPAATSSDEDYWRRRFGDGFEPLEMPLDRPRPPLRSSRGGRVRQTLDPGAVASVERFASTAEASPFAVLVALTCALAHRWAGTREVVVATPAALRDRPGAADVIGYLVNLLPLRVDVAGDPTLGEVVERVKDELSRAHAHAAFPFEQLLRLTPARRDGADSGLTRLVVVQEVPLGTPLALGDVVVDALDVDPGTARYELTVFFRQRPGSVEVVWEYSEDVFDRATVRRLARGFASLASCAATSERRVGALPLMDEDDRRRIVEEFNDTATTAPLSRDVVDLFEEQVAAAPSAPAVGWGTDWWTYRELNLRSDDVARSLVAAGVRPGDAVAVYLDRSADFVAAVLGALKAGGCYVPVDRRTPPARAETLRRMADARAVVARRGALDPAPGVHYVVPEEIAPGQGPPQRAPRASESSCYAMFTSGSTGTPKAVVVPDRAVVRLVRAQWFTTIAPSDTLALVSNLSFDASTLELWGALLNGARLVIVPDSTIADPRSLGAALSGHRVAAGFFSASFFQHLLHADPGAFATFHTLLVGGEAVPQPLVERAARHVAPSVLVNGYGPTENTTFSCCHRFSEVPPPGAAVPIGRPISNSTAYVVADDLGLLPAGVPGEIAVGGAGVAHGYLNDPGLTAARFVPDPYSATPGERLYLTGDFGRYHEDGVIEYLGRRDAQVKVRGHRVELGEVEQLLLGVDGVRAAVAVAPVEHGTRTLVAVVETDRPVDAAAVRRSLLGSVPDYLVPARIAVADRIPVTANGKADRDAAARLAAAPAPSSAPASPAPVAGGAAVIARLWEEVLGVAAVDGVPFFEAGGDSLKLIRLRESIERELGVEVALVQLLEHPTIAQQAALLDRDGPSPDPLRDRARERARRRISRRAR